MTSEGSNFLCERPHGADHLPLSTCVVIVNSIFLQRPQKRDLGNQLIHRRLSKTKSTGSGSDSESQASRHSDDYGGWCLELRRGGRHTGRTGQIRIGFVEEQCFKFGVKELCRDSKG